eukprot:263974-Amphidinium_carterae.1
MAPEIVRGDSYSGSKPATEKEPGKRTLGKPPAIAKAGIDASVKAKGLQSCPAEASQPMSGLLEW